MGMFKRGFKAVSEENARQEEERKKRGKTLFRFFLSKDKDEADITFLTEQPVNFYEHTIQRYVNGKERYDSVPCIGEGCKYCEEGLRPSFKSAWLIIDHRETSYKDKDGKQHTSKDNLRLFVQGTKVSSQLDRKSERYGLMGREYTVVRLGTGTSTTYTFEHGDPYTITREEIESVMPDFIKEQYDGTVESLYSIIENQISMLVDSDSSNNVDDDEDEDIDDTLVSIDDEDDKPKKRLGFKKKSKVENSLKGNKKPSIKDILNSK